MRTLLILDLDETLVHPRSEPLAHRSDGFDALGWYVYERPHLVAFLEWCRQHFTVAVWTSADADYASMVVQRIMKVAPEFLWTKRQCMPVLHRASSQVVWSKPLDAVLELGWSLDRVVWVDNSPEKFALYPCNGVAVPDYLGENLDTALLQLRGCLERCLHADDVRTVDKSDWLTVE